MLEQSLIKTNFLGRDGFIWWIGQIVDETQWAGNFGGHPTQSVDEQKGFGFRYKVRIMGYHTASPSDLPDEDLPWASVLFPVTAGVSGGAISTPNLRQGDFVQGFFMDGEDGQQPVIIGVLGYNQYTAVMKNIPDTGFMPFSGYTVKDQVPQYNLPLKEKDSGASDAKAEDVKESEINNDEVIDSSVRAASVNDGASEEQKKNEEKPLTVAKESRCEKAPVGAIQTKAKNMIADIQRIKKTKTDWISKVSTKIDNVEAEIDKITDNAIKDITADVKKITQGIQENAINKVNESLSKTFDKVYPSQLGELKNKVEEANDELACAFKNIMKNLTGMVGGFLKQMIDKVINTAECLINSFVGSLLGKITGLIDGAVGAVMNPIKSLLSGMGQATEALDDVLGFATNALSFLSCDEDPNCSDVKDWNPTDGPTIRATLDLQGIFGKAKSAADSVKGAFDGIKNIGSSIDGIVKSADFSDIFENSCNVGPLFCGPPTVSFGSGEAKGNAIIGLAGTLLGVDIITPGGDYIGPPSLKFNDSCNKGVGASGKAVIEDGRVVKVIMDDTGTGYLPAPDGSQGGDGRTWAESNETTVKRADGTYDTPYSPGAIIELCPGDEVTYPGQEPELIFGGDCENVTAPLPPEKPSRGLSPSTGTGEYPVVLEIDEINITNPGFGYDPNDKVIIEPSNGAELKIRTDDLGSVIGVDVVNGGIGFTDDPNIYIQSDSGYNARMIPVFKVNRVGEDIDPVAVSPADVVQVVDCVGKF
jgi:hypothetical protein